MLHPLALTWDGKREFLPRSTWLIGPALKKPDLIRWISAWGYYQLHLRFHFKSISLQLPKNDSLSGNFRRFWKSSFEQFPGFESIKLGIAKLFQLSSINFRSTCLTTQLRELSSGGGFRIDENGIHPWFWEEVFSTGAVTVVDYIPAQKDNSLARWKNNGGDFFRGALFFFFFWGETRL